jgi:GMP synthase (glutamine-hydrolysing)
MEFVMRIHFIQHVPFESPGSITDWAEAYHHTTTYTKVFEAALFPAAESFDMLIIMGGPMGCHEEEKYKWMKEEKLFIKNAIAAKKKVLGVCLGSQLVAEALGAKVYSHAVKEIGWFPVEKVFNHPLTDFLPPTFTTFHWHGDTFNLPNGAIQLFKTKACDQQGFVYNNHVATLQFHMEVREDLLQEMAAHERAELIKDTYVQTEEEIIQFAPPYLEKQKQYMYTFLNAFSQL